MRENLVQKCFRCFRASRLHAGLSFAAWQVGFGVVFILLAFNSIAGAATYSWQVVSGDWSVASNWGGTVPNSAATVYVADGGTASITASGALANLLYVGDTASSTSGAIQLSSGSLSAGTEYVGNSGGGAFFQPGGTNKLGSGSLDLASSIASVGSYNLSGTGKLVAGNEYVGFWGTGAVSQSGGTNFVSSGGTLDLGYNSSGGGSYALSGSGFLSARFQYVGYSGSGAMTQSGGTNSLANNGMLFLGFNPSGSGSYTLSGSGSLLTGLEYEYVGYSGIGAFVQTAGTNNTTTNIFGNSDPLYIAYSQGSSGSYSLSGSAALLATVEYVGYSGSGSFVQTGGMNNVVNAGSLYIGYGQRSSYSLSGSGMLSAGDEYVGYYGSGAFVQTGGTNIVANNFNSSALYIAYNAGSSGSYSLGGSAVLSAGAEYVGGFGSGTFSQSGGTNNVMNNGPLYVGSEQFGIVQGSSGSYSLGGSAVLSAGAEYVGYSGSGTFNQSGGFNSTGTLYISSQGRYQFSAGTLQLTSAGFGLENHGIFDATGSSGLLTVAASSILDLTTAVLVNSGSMSVSMGPDSLLLLPAGLDPTTAFASFSSQGLIHNVGTPLTVLPGQGFVGTATITDFVSCQGAISSQWSTTNQSGTGSINLRGGVAVSGTGNVNLGNGAFTADSPQSGVSGGVLTASTGYVGYSATGTFTHTGGTVNVNDLYLGYNAGSNGTYNLGGSAVLSAASEFVGNGGTGLFAQAGGLNAATDLFIGSQGTYSFAGGTLQVGGLFVQGVFDATNSTGALIITGSQIADLSQAILVNTGSMSLSIGPGCLVLVSSGFNPSAFASYGNQGMTHLAGTPLTISPGQSYTADLSLNDMLVCQGSIAAVSGGSINLYGGVSISGTGKVNLGGGAFFADNASWSVFGGSLTASAGYVGYAGTGSFTQSGGVHTLSAGAFNGPLYLGYNTGSNGTYTLSGSGVLNTTSEFVGYSGLGTMNQAGGSNTTSFFGAFYIGYNAGASGHYNQSGGTNNVVFGGALYLGDQAGSIGAYSLSGSGLLTASTEYVGYSGSGSFTQSGGSNSAGNLSIGDLGSYQFTGGTLHLTNLANQGVFNATGCTGLLAASGSAIVDLSTANLINTGSMSLSVGPDSLLLLPAGFNPLASFGSYSNQGLTHDVGTQVLIPAGQGFAGSGSINDFVNCQGTISAGNGSINLNGGVSISGSGNVNLGNNGASVNDAASTMSGGTLQAYRQYVGDASAGTLAQSGGQNSIEELYLGYNAGSSGMYGLSGTGVTSAYFEYVGYSGTGAFTQSGGTNVVSGWLFLAQNAGSMGRYNLNAGLLTIAGGMVAGSGNAAFDLGAGTLQASGPWSSSVDITLTDSGQAGTINMAGNSITLSGDISGGGGLTINGAGSLVLAGSNSYAGTTTVESGTLIVAGADAIPNGASLIIGAEAASILGTVAAAKPSIQSPAVVPEPSTLALLGAVTLALFGGSRWKQRLTTRLPRTAACP